MRENNGNICTHWKRVCICEHVRERILRECMCECALFVCVRDGEEGREGEGQERGMERGEG